MFLWISLNSCPLNLLLVRSHQAEIIIIKRLIQGRNNVTRVRVEPRSFDQGRRKNDAFTHSATVPTEFLVKVYFPCWFTIKIRCKLTDGVRNFFYMMERIREISSSSIQTIMRDVMQQNRFFADSENILVAMLSDDNENLRRIAVNKILKVRESIQGKPLRETKILAQDHVSSSSSLQEVRKFRIPQIDFAAKSYNTMQQRVTIQW